MISQTGTNVGLRNRPIRFREFCHVVSLPLSLPLGGIPEIPETPQTPTCTSPLSRDTLFLPPLSPPSPSTIHECEFFMFFPAETPSHELRSASLKVVMRSKPHLPAPSHFLSDRHRLRVCKVGMWLECYHSPDQKWLHELNHHSTFVWPVESPFQKVVRECKQSYHI